MKFSQEANTPAYFGAQLMEMKKRFYDTEA
jgi:hypothetical protein